MVAASMGRERAGSHGFYLGMAGLFVLIAFGGFIPTYWAQLAAGRFHAAPIVHIHGALFFTWTLFFFAQTALVAAGRTPDHRGWGMAGISLATAMAITIVLATINSMKTGQAAGMAEGARAFAIVPLGALIVFVPLFAVAIAKVRRTELHKRLMLLTMIPLMHAALFRVWRVLSAPDAAGPPPPSSQAPPGIAADLLIVAAMAYDWRTRGRPHPVYWIGGGAILAEQLLGAAFGNTGTWLSVAAWVQSLAG
jgi:hypothetical protein